MKENGRSHDEEDVIVDINACTQFGLHLLQHRLPGALDEQQERMFVLDGT